MAESFAMAEEVEKRRVVRHRTLKSAKIVFNNGHSTIDCVVRNLTELGARVRAVTIVGVPDKFELSLVGKDPRACHVIWRTAQELGVAFE